MRRGVIVAGFASVATVAVVVVTVPSWASHRAAHHHAGTESARQRVQQVAASLTDPGVLASYDVTTGRLVSADVCLGSTCVHRTFGPQPTCAPPPTTCIGTSLSSRRLSDGVTITVEVAPA